MKNLSNNKMNRISWTRQRISDYIRYLQGDRDRTFRGKKKDGTPYRNAVPVRTLIERQSSVKYSTANNKLYADDGKNKLRIISPESVEKMVKALYKNKAIAVGKAPSIFDAA